MIGSDGQLGLTENRLDAMMHFAVSRHAMYRQVYQHRVLLSADLLVKTLARRARDLGSNLEFADETMQAVLASKDTTDLSLENMFWMREGWWRYHLQRWTTASDQTLADLADRLLNRKLFKTVRIRTEDDETLLVAKAKQATEQAGFDPAYYLHVESAINVHKGESGQTLNVALDDGSNRPIGDSDPLFQALAREDAKERRWIILPAEAKEILGRTR